MKRTPPASEVLLVESRESLLQAPLTVPVTVGAAPAPAPGAAVARCAAEMDDEEE